MISIVPEQDMSRKAQLDRSNQKGMKIANDMVSQLREHFDTVQIFVTSHQSDELGTFDAALGAGHYLARISQIEEWILMEQQARHQMAFRQPEQGEEAV